MELKTIIVHTPNREWLPNFKILGENVIFSDLGVRVKFVEELKAGVMDGHFDVNADFSIIGFHGHVEDDILPQVKIIRRNKPIMNALFNKHAIYAKNYRQIETYVTTAFNGIKEGIPATELPGEWWKHEKLIIKPVAGARGDGQFLFNPKMEKIEDVTKQLFKYCRGPKENKFDKPITISTLSDEGYVCKQIVEQGIFFQEYLTDIAKEYRLIVTPTQLYLNLRDRVENGDVIQGTSRQSVDGYRPVSVSELGAVGFDGIKGALRGCGIQFGAVDLFIDENGKWGFIEYSNEMGVYGIEPSLHSKMVRDSLRHWVQQYLNNNNLNECQWD